MILRPFSFKILTSYIIKTFFVRFLVILTFAGILTSLIDVSSTGSFSALNVVTSFGKIFSFAFFISSAWTLILMQKTREFIILQVCSLSTFKILLKFFAFNLIFCLFYFFVYDGYIIKNLHTKPKESRFFLPTFSVYNKISDGSNGSFQFLVINSVLFDEKKQSFSFKDGDFFQFQEGKFQKYIELKKDIILRQENLLVLNNNEIEMLYNFDTLAKYFKENINKKAFKTFFEKVNLVREFNKYNLENRKLKLEIFEELQNAISFFQMTLLAFLFFSYIPPRSAFISRFFMAICVISTIYIVNLILIGWIKQFEILSPSLMLAFPSFILISMLGIIVTRKV
jgi:lipopolysaccharide export LptBFGC system permease protein LptF